MLDNGHYGETGGQLSHTGLGVDLGTVARAAGFPRVMDVTAEADIDAARRQMGRVEGGPCFIRVRITHEDTPRALPTRDGAFLKERMRAHIGV